MGLGRRGAEDTTVALELPIGEMIKLRSSSDSTVDRWGFKLLDWRGTLMEKVPSHTNSETIFMSLNCHHGIHTQESTQVTVHCQPRTDTASWAALPSVNVVCAAPVAA